MTVAGSGAVARPPDGSTGAPPPRRRRLTARAISRVALIYGVIGVVLAVLTLGAAFWASGRFQDTSQRMAARAVRIEGVLNSSALALETAATAIGSAGATIDSTAAAIDSAATSINAAATSLSKVADSAAGVSILGQQPLAGISDGFNNTATHLADLSTSLSGVATALRGNKTALAAVPVALTNLATNLRAAGDGLADDVTAGLDDVQSIFMVTFLVAALWFGAPAIASIAFGLWLRRYPEDAASLGAAA